MRLRKTAQGQAAFAARSPLFNPRQRAFFLMCDGNKLVADLLGATAGMGTSQADVDHLLDNGLLEPVDRVFEQSVTQPAELTESAPRPLDDKTKQERYFQAKPMATQLTASLGLRGFRLNLGVESAAGYDDLLALFPRIQEAVGRKACRDLERILRG